MQDIEAKTKLKASEGAHLIFTLIFLTGSSVILRKYSHEKCNQDFVLINDLIFYGLVIWSTYLIVTLVPQCKNPAIKIYFNFLDIVFGLYLFAIFLYGNILYFRPNDCSSHAPTLSFFIELFLIVTWVIFIIIALAGVGYLFRLLSKKAPEHDFRNTDF
jgi:hypothetical protein